MKIKRMLHWYPLFPYARRENILSLRLIREQYDKLFRDMADYNNACPIANTPLIYALIKRSDERVFVESQQQALRDIRYLESRTLPPILAIAEERGLEVTNRRNACSEPTTLHASLVNALEKRGSVLDGWDDTFESVCTSGTLSSMMCDCSQGVPELTPIALNYQPPATPTGAGFLTDVTILTKLLHRASSL